MKEYSTSVAICWKRFSSRGLVVRSNGRCSNTTSDLQRSSKSSRSWQLQIPLKHTNHLMNPSASGIAVCIIQMFRIHHRSPLTFPWQVGEHNSGVTGKAARWELHLSQAFITSNQMYSFIYLFTFTHRNVSCGIHTFTVGMWQMFVGHTNSIAQLKPHGRKRFKTQLSRLPMFTATS
jgi:hypothetical protein